MYANDMQKLANNKKAGKLSEFIAYQRRGQRSSLNSSRKRRNTNRGPMFRKVVKNRGRI